MVALAVLILGALVVIAGVALASIPAAVILAGLVLVAFGVLFLDLERVKGGRRGKAD